MKARLDQLGRITLPIQLRRDLGLKAEMPLDITVEEGLVILTKSGCIFCGSRNDIINYRGRIVCRPCAKH